MTTFQNLTKEDLIDAIRGATSLAELRRLVGPSDAMNQEAENRLKKLDEIAEACDWGNMFPDYRAQLYREKWGRIMAEQSAFEAEYC